MRARTRLSLRKSLARRLARLIQPNVRSTTQRLGNTMKPLICFSLRLTTADGDTACFEGGALRLRRRCSLNSTKLIVTNGLLRRTSRKTGASASRSCVSADVIWHSIGRPSVSTATWRLRPLIFLAASKPRGPPAWVVLTDWLSTTTAVGAASRPSASRAPITRTHTIWVDNPLSRQASNRFCTVVNGGKSLGSSRQGQNARFRSNRAFNISRAHVGLRPRLLERRKQRKNQREFRLRQIA